MPADVTSLLLYLAMALVLIAALWDRLRSVEIPMILVLAPFAVAAATLIINAQYLILALAILLLFVSQVQNAILRRVLSLACIIGLALFRWDIAIFIFIFWLFYEFNYFAGADALACLSLVLIRPDMILGIWLMIGIMLGSWFIGIRRHGLSYFKKAFQALGGVFTAPVTEEQLIEQGEPLLWTVSLGCLLYLLMVIFIL